jgi:hypothetical protein
MDAHIEIIYDMLKDIRGCPNGRCSACNSSVSIASSSLDTLVERIEKIRAELRRKSDKHYCYGCQEDTRTNGGDCSICGKSKINYSMGLEK